MKFQCHTGIKLEPGRVFTCKHPLKLQLFVARITSPPTCAANFHFAESKCCFYFLQLENLLRAEVVIRGTNHRKLQESVVFITYPDCHGYLPEVLFCMMSSRRYQKECDYCPWRQSSCCFGNTFETLQIEKIGSR